MSVPAWTLKVDDHVDKPMVLALDDLESNLQLECGEKGHALFSTPTDGNQWAVGWRLRINWASLQCGPFSGPF